MYNCMYFLCQIYKHSNSNMSVLIVCEFVIFPDFFNQYLEFLCPSFLIENREWNNTFCCKCWVSICESDKIPFSVTPVNMCNLHHLVIYVCTKTTKLDEKQYSKKEQIQWNKISKQGHFNKAVFEDAFKMLVLNWIHFRNWLRGNIIAHFPCPWYAVTLSDHFTG